MHAGVGEAWLCMSVMPTAPCVNWIVSVYSYEYMYRDGQWGQLHAVLSVIPLRLARGLLKNSYGVFSRATFLEQCMRK